MKDISKLYTNFEFVKWLIIDIWKAKVIYVEEQLDKKKSSISKDSASRYIEHVIV